MNYGQASVNSQETPWIQPVLNKNGQFGVDELAVQCNYSSTTAYYIFDGSQSSNYFSCSGYANPTFLVYVKSPIKISNVKFEPYSYAHQFAWSGATIYGSNDNSTWKILGSGNSTTNNSTVIWNISISDIDFYNYFKIEASCPSNCTAMGEITLTANKITYAINSITFPYSHNNNDYSYCITYHDGVMGNSYCSTKTHTGLKLQNNSNASTVYYMTLGY